ncbi:MAG: flavin reductase [SAR324 cluster bacterium]|nr:flavin reductase [SAR324 cluster bacterium]
MDAEMKKTALRMVPYGLYILTAEDKQGRMAASAVSWVTQSSFDPPQIAIAIKENSLTHNIVKDSNAFVLNMLRKDQASIAPTFYKTLEPEGNTIGGEPFFKGKTGSPIFQNAPAFIECTVVGSLEKGDHSVFVAEVVDAGVRQQPEGRPDDSILLVKDLGEKTFYSG